MPRSVVVRLGLLVFISQLLCALVVLAVVDRQTRGEIVQASHQLSTELQDELLAAYRQGGSGAVKAAIGERLASKQDHDKVMLLAAPDGARLAGDLSRWPGQLGRDWRWRVVSLRRLSARAPERMGVSGVALPDGNRLLTGHVIESGLRFGRVLEEAMLSALLLATPLALLAGWLSARLINLKVRSVVATARAIATGEMERRVPVDLSDDVFADLARAINAMLDRIAGLVDELRLVTDGLAHDLRSPLTRLKSALDRCVAEAEDGADRALLARAIEEADILLSMLTTALLISRAEAGIGRDQFRPTDLSAMLVDVAEMYQPLAEDHGIVISVESPDTFVLPVNRELLSQALANLIDNALKYGGRHILLRTSASPDGAILSVTDDGPGIAADRREEAMRRFGRLDSARHATGAGLGLSLAAAVARLHGGSLRLEEGEPGLRVVLTLGA